MLRSVRNWIVRRLKKYLPQQENMHSALSYGVDMALYTVISTTGLILISCAQKSFIPGVIIIAIFYVNQTIGGGYHANTHMKCFLTMSILLSIGIRLSKLPIPKYVLCILSIASLILLLHNPVILHPNKAFLKNKLPQFIIRSRYISLFELLLAIIFTIFQFQIFDAYTIGLVLSAISRITARYSKHCNSAF